jgi:hypothetical protein
MKTARLIPTYSITLAANLDDLSKALGIPRKILNRWRKEWLSYPVSPEQFETLRVIAGYIWGVNTILKTQLARMSSSDRIRLVNDAGIPKPMSYCRNIILKRMLSGEPSLPSKVLIGRVRSFYPNGYVCVTPKAIRAARAWARRNFIKANLNPENRDMLLKSMNNIDL